MKKSERRKQQLACWSTIAQALAILAAMFYVITQFQEDSKLQTNSIQSAKDYNIAALKASTTPGSDARVIALQSLASSSQSNASNSADDKRLDVTGFVILAVATGRTVLTTFQNFDAWSTLFLSKRPKPYR